jgi:hypothetical protein
MNDIVERIRTLRYVHVPVASQLMAEAADEIERLRNGAVDARETVRPHVRGKTTHCCSLNFTITDEEREAIEQTIDAANGMAPAEPWTIATLRSLLEKPITTPTTHATPAEGAVQAQCTFTAEERAAILTAADLLIGSKPGATLRSLLARLA